MRFALVTLCLLIASVGDIGCARYAPLDAHVTQTNVDPASAYAKVLKVIAERGYNVIEQKDAELYVRVRAHVDETRADHQSFISAQVDPSGRVTLTPSGVLVHDNKVHKKLASEVTYLEDALRGEFTRTAASASASAPEPPPAPPATSEPAPPPPVEAVAPIPTAPSKPAPSKPGPAPTKPQPKPKGASGDDWVPVK